MTVDQMADHVGIGRTAVNQHLATLRQRGYVVNGQVLKGRGRPRKSYVLTNVKIMNEAGFDARVVASQADEVIPRIECKNCVYHDLARDYTQVCQFDLGFLSGLMEQ